MTIRKPIRLTERQYQILQLTALGYINKEIAGKLEITESTVKVHMQAILSALNVRNKTQAAVLLALGYALPPKQQCEEKNETTVGIPNSDCMPSRISGAKHPR